MIDANVLSNEHLSAPQALRLQHDDLRAGFVSAIMIPGSIANAAKRVARMCVGHFEEEEDYVYPVFEVLDRLVSHGVQPDMEMILPLVSRFCERHIHLRNQHRSIVTAITALLEAARNNGNKEVADLAYRLLLHEREDDLLIYPIVVLIGNCVREQLAVKEKKKRACAGRKVADDSAGKAMQDKNDPCESQKHDDAELSISASSSGGRRHTT